MAMHQFLLLFLLALATSTAIARDVAHAVPTAYEMLEKFGFPKGILPVGVRGYKLNRTDGRFEVFLERECEFQVDGSYLLKYQEKISGKVGHGRLEELNGVTVKVFLVYWGIDKVVRSDADLRFYVGPLSQSFPADNFQECPQCRCGFACGGDHAAVEAM